MIINDLIEQHKTAAIKDDRLKKLREKEKDRTYKAIKAYEKELLEEFEWKYDPQFNLLKPPEPIRFSVFLNTRKSRFDAPCYEKREYSMKISRVAYQDRHRAHKITHNINGTNCSTYVMVAVYHAPAHGSIVYGLQKLEIYRWLLNRNNSRNNKMTDKRAADIILNKVGCLDLSAIEMEALETIKRKIEQ